MSRIYPFEEDTIVVGDCLDIMTQMPDGCVDLIITDPPYPKKYLYLYEYLAEQCPRIMKRGASLLFLAGHYAIPNIIKIFDGKLKYRWMICMNQFDGKHARMRMGIEITWKPIFWYVKDAYPQGRGFVVDGFRVTGKDGQNKELHKWQQDASWARFLIEKFSTVGDLVFDPMIGSGTVAIEARKLGRNFFGCDTSPDSVRESLRRLDES